MKNNKLTATVLAILSLCFPLCACTDLVDPIEYTAEKPLVEYHGNKYWHSVVTSFDLAFTHFKNYYVENYKGSGLFLFDTCVGERVYAGYYPPYYEIIEEEDGLYVYEDFEHYDADLGAPYHNPNYSGSSPSFYGKIAIRSISINTDETVFSFEFGKTTLTEYRENRYANIFANGECFATFYYLPRTKITQKWFENFLTENLVWGDSLEYEETEDEI